MKRFSIMLLLTVLFLPYYASAQEPLCPCDTARLDDGLTGNDIIEINCPNGSLGSDSGSTLNSDVVGIFIIDFPHTDYFAEINNVGQFFSTINNDGVFSVQLQILNQDYQSCRQELIDRCGLLARNIPTLSEWGLIAMSGILGIAGLMVARRRKAAT